MEMNGFVWTICKIAVSVIWKLSNLTKHKLIKTVTNSESRNPQRQCKVCTSKEIRSRTVSSINFVMFCYTRVTISYHIALPHSTQVFKKFVNLFYLNV